MNNPTTVLRELLSEAERRYGPRTHQYPVFVACYPDCHQPFTAPSKDQSSIFVFISEVALLSLERSRFEIAHEAVHCLEPCRKPAPVIEEGVATLFSLTASGISAEFAGEREADLATSYHDALEDVRTLLHLCPDAIGLLRSKGTFRALTPITIQAETGAPAALAERLCQYR
jgi:hypothetical protein